LTGTVDGRLARSSIIPYPFLKQRSRDVSQLSPHASFFSQKRRAAIIDRRSTVYPAGMGAQTLRRGLENGRPLHACESGAPSSARARAKHHSSPHQGRTTVRRPICLGNIFSAWPRGNATLTLRLVEVEKPLQNTFEADRRPWQLRLDRRNTKCCNIKAPVTGLRQSHCQCSGPERTSVNPSCVFKSGKSNDLMNV
jgi:hypothetical protein